jgi:prevent-host-death family protein
MRERIPAAEFKAKCLKIMDQVAATGETVAVTKHGRPVARLVPVERGHTAFIGCLKGSVTAMSDLISPTGEQWEADGV